MDIYDEIITVLQNEPRIRLATIIATSGSTPAAPLSKMLVRGGGTSSVGTVGGGCMEGEVLLRARQTFGNDNAEILTFNLNEDDPETGLICGGSLDILLEPLDRSSIPLFTEVAARRSAGKDSLIVTLLDGRGAVTAKACITTDGTVTIPPAIADRIPACSEVVHRVLQRMETERIRLGREEIILEPVAGIPELVIFGGGHISRSLCQVAAMAGFRVTVVDDREKFSNQKRFPAASKTRVLDFSLAADSVGLTDSTFVVIVTRGHRFDEEILGHILRKPVAYVGMIGSRKKVLAAYEHLLANGISPERLQSVFAPIGLDIGALTPEEISVSIVAELIAFRRGRAHSVRHMSDAMQALVNGLTSRPPQR